MLVCIGRSLLRDVCFTHTRDSRAPCKSGRSQHECPIAKVPRMRHWLNSSWHHSRQTQKAMGYASCLEIENILSIKFVGSEYFRCLVFGVVISGQWHQCRCPKITESLKSETLLTPSFGVRDIQAVSRDKHMLLFEALFNFPFLTSVPILVNLGALSLWVLC